MSHTNKLVDTCKLRRHSTTPAGHHHNQLHEHCRQGHARHLVYSLAAELSELPTDGLKLTGFFFARFFRFGREIEYAIEDPILNRYQRSAGSFIGEALIWSRSYRTTVRSSHIRSEISRGTFHLKCGNYYPMKNTILHYSFELVGHGQQAWAIQDRGTVWRQCWDLG